MFFSKSLLVVAALAAQALAHTMVAPALGIKGTPIRANTQRPSTAKPCGNAALSAIDTSTPIAMTGTSFTATSTAFNANKDGTMVFTAQVDPTGAGKGFKAATITKNGLASPKVGDKSQLAVSLPAGTKCTGGKTGDLCLVSFKSASGFGNCVVVKQAGAGAASAKASTKKTTRSRHPREFVVPAAKRDYAKRAISWVWAPSADAD